MKTALVTGGTHGIGLATALALKEQGLHVAICARDTNRLADLEMNCGLFGIRADIQSDTEISGVMTIAEEDLGGIDILCLNAGGGGSWGKPSVTETHLSTWDEVHQKNARAAALFTQFALPHMMKQGWGRVITVASIYGKESGGRPWFDGTKAYEIAMMKSMSRMPGYVRRGITFNTVAPGRIAVGGKEDDLTPEVLARDYPMGRVGTPEEVASVIRFLCSDEARYVNGACIAVDGGESRSF